MIRPRPQVIALILLGLWAAWPPRPVDAGQIKISPIRIDLSAASPAGIVTVGNPGDQPMLLHLRLKAWSHTSGSDEFHDSRDVLLNPMIFELGPGQDQVVRIGLTSPLRGEREGAFRLFIQEVPNGAGPKRQSVATRLRVSLPLFVAPKQPIPPVLQWRLLPRPGSDPVLRVENRGNLHAQVSSIGLFRSGGESLAAIDQSIYVLPGQGREWVIPGDGVSDGELLTLTASIGEGRIETALRLGSPSAIEEALR